MLNLVDVVAALDCFSGCSSRVCRDCKQVFNTSICPQEVYRDTVINVLKVLEKYLDDKYDKEHGISEADFINLLIGE